MSLRCTRFILADRRLPLLLALAAAGAAATAWLAASSAVPLGVRAEWTWRRLPGVERAELGGLVVGLLGLVVALGLAVAVAVGARRDGSAMRRTGALILLLLLVGGFSLGIDTVMRGGTSRWIDVLYSQPISGVFTLVSDGAASSDEMLTDFENSVQGRGTHITNNPPGLIVVYRSVWRFFERHGEVARAVTECQPPAVRKELARLASIDGRAAPPAAGATLWSIALVSRVLAIAVALPVVWLAGMRLNDNSHRAESDGYDALTEGFRQADRDVCGAPREETYGLALLAGVLAGLMPAAILFAPRQDTVYPTVAVLIVGLACRAFNRRSSLTAAAAGLLVSAGMFFSLAFCVVAAMAALFLVLNRLGASAPERRGHAAGELAPQQPKGGSRLSGLRVLIGGLRLPLAAAVGWVVGPLLLYVAWRCDIFAIWHYNIREHSDFYSTNLRTYEAWLCVNPIEFVVAMGVPAAVFAGWRVASQLRRFAAGRSFDALALGWAGTLLALNLSGLNMGEVARLWLPFMPFGGVLAAQAVGELTPRVRGWCAAALVLLQAACCLVLALYVRVM